MVKEKKRMGVGEEQQANPSINRQVQNQIKMKEISHYQFIVLLSVLSRAQKRAKSAPTICGESLRGFLVVTLTMMLCGPTPALL